MSSLTLSLVAHTHQQIDENPCPYMSYETADGGRSCPQGRCEYRRDTFFSFETFGKALLEGGDLNSAQREREREQWQREEESYALERERAEMDMSLGFEDAREMKRANTTQSDHTL
jgi:hypothetical protein